MMILCLILLLLALLAFVLAAFNVPGGRLNLTAAGLACCVAYLLCMRFASP
jgi:hypothetical protein